MKKQKSKKTKIFLSILALAEVVVLAAGITFSWMEGGNRGYINGKDIQISTGSGLTMIKDGRRTNTISLDACELAETSSADGRNFFFPMADTESSKTNEMTFREGTASDRNQKYISMDFQLVAGSSATEVYLGAGTIIQCKDNQQNEKLLSALRMSFSENDGSTPVVFKPNQMPGINRSFSPITSIDNDGKASQTSTSTKAFGDYYFDGSNKESLFSLSEGETKNITLSIWLEGTEFTNNDVAEKDLSVYIDFTTTVDDLVRYNFVDNTHGYSSAKSEYWITDKEVDGKYDTMMYVYDNTTKRYYAMTKSSNYDNDHTWIIYVPDSVKDFSFRRYSVDINQPWNEWVPSMTDVPTDSNGQFTYVAICGVQSPTDVSNPSANFGPCGGYWKDQDGTFRVYFENSIKWDNLHCYVWKNGGDVSGIGAYPGKRMTFSHNSINKNAVYYIDLKESDDIEGISFNNGNDNDKYQIDNPQYFFNGFATWYNGTGSDKYIYTGTKNSKIFSN